MPEFLSSVFLGYSLLYLLVFTGFIIALIVSDLNESLSAMLLFTAIIIAVSYYTKQTHILEQFTFTNLGLYLFVGFFFATVRTRLLGMKLTEDEKKYVNLKSKVFRRWFFWPFSLVNWILGSLLKDAWNLLYKAVEKLFVGLLNGKF